MLGELLTKDTIRLNVKVKNWEEAIRMGGQLLVQEDAVEQSYVEAMVRAVKELGPYIVIAPGFAMPHARAEDGVKKIAMSLLTLESPVAFGNPDNDPVAMVICLAAVDHTTHIKAMRELAVFLNDADKMRQIKSTREVKDVLALLQF